MNARVNTRVVRGFFMLLCTGAGFSISQVRPDLLDHPGRACLIGFGFGGILVAFDEMLKGFSIRAFSAATAGLAIGTIMAWIVDRSGLFDFAAEEVRWLIRLGLFLSFSYLGMVIAMRSNKEDFSLIVPYVRFASQTKPDNLFVIDTSAVIDGRIAGLVELNLLEGKLIIPRFVLRELHQLSDSADEVKRARGRRGLELLQKLQAYPKTEVKIHEAEFPGETEVDAKLVLLASALSARLVTNDSNLARVASLQSVKIINLVEMGALLKAQVLPGDTVRLRIAREGRERGQGVGYLADGTMVVVNGAGGSVGETLPVRVGNLTQTGAGVMIFAEKVA